MKRCCTKKGIFRKQELLGIKVKKIEIKISIESFENQVEEISQKVGQKDKEKENWRNDFVDRSRVSHNSEVASYEQGH